MGRFLILALVVAACSSADKDIDAPLDVATLRSMLDSVEAFDLANRNDDAHRLLVAFRRGCPPSLPADVLNRYYISVASICFSLEQYDVAIDAAAELSRDNNEADEEYRRTGQLFLGHALKKAGDTSLALLAYHNALALSKQHSSRDMHVNIAWLSTALGHYDSALAHVHIADSMYRAESRFDGNSILLYSLIRTRAYAGTGMRHAATQALEHFVHTLENNRPQRTTKQLAVRLSMLNGLWRDSNVVRKAVPHWHHLRNRIVTIMQRDAEARSARQAVERTFDFDSLASYSLVPLPLRDVARPMPDIANGSVITSTAIDTYSWQWVGTLHGLYLRTVQVLLPIDIPRRPYTSMAIRDMTISGDTLFIARYAATPDTIPLHQLLPYRTRLKGATASPRLHIAQAAPRAITGMLCHGDTVLWFSGTDVAVGTSAGPTTPWRTVRSTPSMPPFTTIYCGAMADAATALIGTSAGLWRLHIGEMLAENITMTGDLSAVNSVATITRITSDRWCVRPRNGQTLALHLRGNTASIPTTPTQLPYGTLGSASFGALLDYQEVYSTMAEVHLPVRRLHRYILPDPVDDFHMQIAQDSVLLWQHAHGAFMLDARSGIIRAFTTNNTAWQRDVRYGGRTPAGGYCFLSGRGAIVVDSSWPMLDHTTMIIAARPSVTDNFRLLGYGDTLRVDADARMQQMLLGLPRVFGSMHPDARLETSWATAPTNVLAGRVFDVPSIPPGSHAAQVVIAGAAQPTPFTIYVGRTILEQWWLWTMMGVLAVAGAVISVLYVRSLRRQRVQERVQALLQERTQIGNDLHDSLGGMLVRMNMMANNLANTEGLEIGRLAREASRTLRDIIWSVSNHQTLDAAVAVAAERITQACTEAGLQLRTHTETVPPLALAPNALRNVILIVTEAMTNIVRHANATMVEYDCRSTPEATVVTLVDNGMGFDVGTSKPGIGLRSMQARASASGFDLNITSMLGEGTTIQLTIPHLPS